MMPMLTIAWKNIYVVFRDRNLLLIMIVTPLTLATIIGLAFGGIGGGGAVASFSDIPVVLVNLDAGVEQNRQRFSYGDILNDLLLPADPNAPQDAETAASACPSANGTNRDATALNELLNVTAMDDPAAARAAVDNGQYTAAVIIPSDYSQRLVSSTPNQQPLIEVYGSAGRPISAGIVNSIVQSIAYQTIKGVAAVQATIGQLVDEAQSNAAFGLYFATLTGLGGWEPDFACAFSGTLDPLTVEREALTLTQTRTPFIQILVTIGTAQAMFFALFTAQGTFGNIFDEKKLGTLPRLFAAPIRRRTVLTGYMVSAFAIVLIQLALLIVALTLVGSAIEGTPQFIWGTSPLLLVMMGAITVSVCGVSLLVVSIVSSRQQSGVIASLLNTFFAFLGGTFGIQLPPAIAGFSPIYWAVDGLSKLSNQSGDITLNVLILLTQGSVMFVIGLILFNRRELV